MPDGGVCKVPMPYDHIELETKFNSLFIISRVFIPADTEALFPLMRMGNKLLIMNERVRIRRSLMGGLGIGEKWRNVIMAESTHDGVYFC